MRYIVITDDTLIDDVEIIFRHDDLESVERFIQSRAPFGVKVYEMKYVTENVLCNVWYEGESDKSDTLSDIATPATDDKVFVCGCPAPKEGDNVICNPNVNDGSLTIKA